MKNAHQIHRNRRASLLAQMRAQTGGGLALVPTAPEFARNRDSFYPYRHDSYFYYVSGFTEPDAVVALLAGKDGDRQILFWGPAPTVPLLFIAWRRWRPLCERLSRRRRPCWRCQLAILGPFRRSRCCGSVERHCWQGSCAPARGRRGTARRRGGNPSNAKRLRAELDALQRSDVTVVEQPEPLGMGDAVLRARREVDARLPRRPLLVCQVHDVVESQLLRELFAAGRGDGDAWLAGQEIQAYFPGGYLLLDGDHVRGIVEKPGPGQEPSNVVSIVLHLFARPDVLYAAIEEAYARRSADDDHYERALDALIGQMDVRVVRYRGHWQAMKSHGTCSMWPRCSWNRCASLESHQTRRSKRALSSRALSSLNPASG